MNILLIIIGLLILIANLIDFFHTTLSAHGYGFLSEKLHKYLAFAILKTQSKRVFTYSGALHLLANAIFWLCLLILGSYFLFLSGEMMVVTSSDHQPVHALGRFYYTCYVLSTTGIGDYVPGTDFSRLVTSVLSFSGFAMISISITYLLSVLNAVNDEKLMASYISTMGENLEKLYHHLETDGNFNLENSSELRSLILKHTSNHLSFPIVQRFLSPKRAYCPVLQLASLYEVLNVIRSKTDKDTQQWKKLESLLSAIHYYLNLHRNEYYEYRLEEEDMKEIRSYWDQMYGESLSQDEEKDELLHLSLKSVGRTWNDIYDFSPKEK